MFGSRSHRLALVGLASVVTAAILVAAPASAASHAGQLRIKGPGSVYSQGDPVLSAAVSEAVGAGQSTQFELQVVNTGIALAQYRVKVLPTTGVKADLYAGSLSLTPLAGSPDGYYTPPIAPGKSQGLSLRVAVPVNSPQATFYTDVLLYATDGTQLLSVVAVTEVKAPANGLTAQDIFARQGAQPYVGGPVNAQNATSPALALGASTTFNVKLQNNGGTPGTVGLGWYPHDAHCTTVTVKDGTTDVTAAVKSGTYRTPVLGVHGTRALKATVKRTGASGCGPYDYIRLTTSLGRSVWLLVPFPAA